MLSRNARFAPPPIRLPRPQLCTPPRAAVVPAERLRLPFSLGLGGRIGSGQQWVSWVALDDAVRALLHCVHDTTLAGGVNVCAPGPVRMADFTAALAACLHRPALLPMPEAVVRAVFGQMGEEMLLASQRGVPERLATAGFKFAHEDVAAGVEAALHGDARGA